MAPSEAHWALSVEQLVPPDTTPPPGGVAFVPAPVNPTTPGAQHAIGLDGKLPFTMQLHEAQSKSVAHADRTAPPPPLQDWAIEGVGATIE